MVRIGRLPRYVGVYVGTGLTMVGAILAAKTHAPNITLVYESGEKTLQRAHALVGRRGSYLPAAHLTLEMPLSFGMAANGCVDISFQGAAEIDMYGNLNTHIVGGGYHDFRHRLTGSGGGNDLASLSEFSILVGLQTPEKFPAKLAFRTSPGFLDGFNTRWEAGLKGKEPTACVTQLGVMDFEPVSKRMRIKALNAGITPEIAQACTGFERLVPDHIEEIPEPSWDVLEILRRDVDPHEVFIAFPPR